VLKSSGTVAFLLFYQSAFARHTNGVDWRGEVWALEFLAPDSATVEATAKVTVKGTSVERSDATT
jgi:hypothetical protein